MADRKRYPYTKRLKLIKAGAGAEYISDNPVKPAKVLVLTSISVEDKTSALTKVRIGKQSGGYFHSWEEALTPAAGELSFSAEEHWIRTAEYFQAELTGGVAADECWAYLDGYWFKWEESE